MRAVLMLTLAVMTSPIEAATHFYVNGLGYEVNSDETSVTLFESNAIYSSELIIPASVTDNNITYSVTAIGDNAFSRHTSLTKITIPASVTSIGEGAFEIILSTEESHLAEVIFGNSSQLTTIGAGAFVKCTSLTKITIPANVTSIGEGAFSGCTGLTEFKIENNNTTLKLWMGC